MESYINGMPRSVFVHGCDLICDMLWVVLCEGDDLSLTFKLNIGRWVSVVFKAVAVHGLLRLNEFDSIVRVREVVQGGYCVLAERGLVIIFTAINYCGDLDNSGVVLIVSDTLECTFKVLVPKFTSWSDKQEVPVGVTMGLGIPALVMDEKGL